MMRYNFFNNTTTAVPAAVDPVLNPLLIIFPVMGVVALLSYFCWKYCYQKRNEDAELQAIISRSMIGVN